MTKKQFINFSQDNGLKVILNQKGKFNMDEEYPQPHDEICEVTDILNCGDHNEYEISDGKISYGLIEIDEFDIICHPLSDLIKPITHKGETFVPIEILWKTYHSDMNASKFSFYDYGDRYVCHSDEYGYENKIYKNMKLNEFWKIEKLIEWHFAIDLNEDEYVDINTLNNNPYK